MFQGECCTNVADNRPALGRIGPTSVSLLAYACCSDN